MKVLLVADLSQSWIRRIFSGLSSLLPGEELSAFLLLNEPENTVFDIRVEQVRYRKMPPERHGRSLPGRIGAIESYFKHRKTREGVCDLSREAATYATTVGAKAIWCLLSSQITVQMAAELRRVTGLPLFVQILEPPSVWVRNNVLDGFTARAALKEFSEVLRHATGCAMVSEPMAHRYKDELGPRIATILPPTGGGAIGGAVAAAADAASSRKSIGTGSGEKVVIGAVDSTFIGDLEKMLETVNWRLAGKEVELRLIDCGPNSSSHGGSAGRIIELKSESVDDLISLLAQCDFLYFSHWVDETANPQDKATYCLPPLLPSYLAAGRPIVYQGPEVGLTADFLRDFGCASMCHGFGVSNLYNQFLYVLANPDYGAELVRNSLAAFENQFSANRLQQALRNLFQMIPVPDLVMGTARQKERPV